MEKVMRNVLRGFKSVGGVFPANSNLPRLSSKVVSVEDKLGEDWQRIGGDIKVAMLKFDDMHAKK